jgi:two-component system response regulator NreC
MEGIRIVLADDHKIFRETLRTIIEKHNDLKVVAEAEDGLAAVEQVQKYLPDIVIMDVRMPGLNGIEATRQIAVNMPEVKIIALSSHSNRQYVEEMQAAGASDYLSKFCSPDELIKCIHNVSGGKTFKN